MAKCLASDMLGEIFSFLPAGFLLLKAARVCKSWKLALKNVKNLQLYVKPDYYSKVGWFNQVISGENEYLKGNIDRLVLKCAKLTKVDLEIVIGQLGLQLKSLKINSRDISQDCYELLMNSKDKLPKLKKLGINSQFNELETDHELSIKSQIVSLRLHCVESEAGLMRGQDTRVLLKSLNYSNLQVLELSELKIEDFTNFPNLKKLKFKDCVVNFKDFKRISANLEELSLLYVDVRQFQEFTSCDLQNLTSLTLSNSPSYRMRQTNVFREFGDRISEFKRIPLKTLHVYYSHDSLTFIKNVCFLDKLTSLEFVDCSLKTSDFLNLLEDCHDFNHLTNLNLSRNCLCPKIIPVLDNFPNLKFLNLSKNSQLNIDDCEVIFGLEERISNLECDGGLNQRYPQSNIEYFDKVSNEISPAELSDTNCNKETISSLDFNKKLSLIIKDIEINHEFIDFSTRNVSFKINTSLILTKSKKISIHSTNFIEKHRNSLKLPCWNKEIEFDCLISQLPCDSYINLSLIKEYCNNEGKITRDVTEFKCPLFDSNLELLQGSVKLFPIIQSNRSVSNIILNVDFAKHDHRIKYDLERKLESGLHKKQFDFIQLPYDLKVPQKFCRFLEEISFESQEILNEYQGNIEKWEKPSIFKMISVFRNDNVGVFAKRIVLKYLDETPDETFSVLFPYLVFCLKFENGKGILQDYLIQRCLKSKVLGNQFFWLLKLESNFYLKCKSILSRFLSNLSTNYLEIIENQCKFLDFIENCQESSEFQVDQPIFLPYTLKQVKKVHTLQFKQDYKSLELEFESGELATMKCISNSEIYLGFIIESFVKFLKISHYKISLSNNLETIENYPTSIASGFVIIPNSLSLVGPKTKIPIPISSELSSKISMEMFMNLTIGILFAVPITDNIYINQQGIIMREHYKMNKSLPDYNLGKQIIVGNIVKDYLKKSGFVQQFVSDFKKYVNDFSNEKHFLSYFEPFYSSAFGERNVSYTFTYMSDLERSETLCMSNYLANKKQKKKE